MLISDFLESLDLETHLIFNRKSVKKLDYGVTTDMLLKRPDAMLWSLYTSKIPLSILTHHMEDVEWFMLYFREDVPIFFFEDHLSQLDWTSFRVWFSRPISLIMGQYIIQYNKLTMTELMNKKLSIELLEWLVSDPNFWTLENREKLSNSHLPYAFIEKYASELCWELASQKYPKDAPIDLFMLYATPHLNFHHMLMHGDNYQEVLFDYFSSELIRAMYYLSQDEIDGYVMYNPHIRLEWWLLLFSETDKDFNYNVVLSVSPSPRCIEIINYIFYKADFRQIALNHSIPDSFIAFKITNAPKEWNTQKAISILREYRPISAEILLLLSDYDFYWYMYEHNVSYEISLDRRVLDRMFNMIVNISHSVQNSNLTFSCVTLTLEFFVKYVPYVPNPNQYLKIFEFYLIYLSETHLVHGPNEHFIKIAKQHYFNLEYLDLFIKHGGDAYLTGLFENPFVEFEVYRKLQALCKAFKDTLSENPFYMARRRELILSKLLSRKIERFLEDWYSPSTTRGIERLIRSYQDESYQIKFKDNYRDTITFRK